MALNRGLLTTLGSRLASGWELAQARKSRLPACESPVFLVGCGRSGTTILGECLARHEDIEYLHEPRELWRMCVPETDVWSRSANQRGGRVRLGPEHASDQQAELCRRVFGYYLGRSQRRLLLEKLPINCFRLGMLHRIFPQARYLYLVRDGREVARSIQTRADNPWNGWYGAGDYKWLQLEELARSHGLADVLPQCQNNYQRGLMEWRLSMEEACAFQPQIGGERWLQISYNELIESPSSTLGAIQDFLQLPGSPRVADFVAQNLQRRTRKFTGKAITEVERAICGERLQDPLWAAAPADSASCPVGEKPSPMAPAIRNGQAAKLANSLSPPAPPKTAKRPWIQRFLMGLVVLGTFWPHLWVIRTLGPKWGLHWAQFTARVHWILTFLGAQKRVRKTLAGLKPVLDTRLTVSQLLRKYLEVKHHSFAEWRLSVTPGGRIYQRDHYRVLPDETEARLRGLIAQGKGVMFVVYHFGMYKMLASALATAYDVEIYKANYISAHYSPSTLGPFAQLAFRNAIRTDRASNTRNIYLRPDSPPVAVIKRLKRGKIMGIAADGMVSADFLEIPFLGGHMRLPAGWARLAAMTQCEVVPMFAKRDGLHGRVIDVCEHFRVPNTDDGVREAVARCARELEARVRKEPWLWHIWHRVHAQYDSQGVLRLSAQPVTLEPTEYHYEPAPVN